MPRLPARHPFGRRLLHHVRALGSSKRPMLLLLLFTSCTAWAFFEVAGEVASGESRALDERILLALREPDDPTDPRGSRTIEEMARDITGLGGIPILTGLTLAAAGYLALRGKGRAVVFLLIAIGSGVIASSLLKQLFARPRPDLVPHGSYVDSASFPSSHSMMSAITYLTLGALLSKVEPRLAIRAYFLLLALLTTLLVGCSRVYLGVHWPTDVLAGWSIGGAWAASCWSVANLLQRRGGIEGPVTKSRHTTPDPNLGLNHPGDPP